MAFCEYIYPYLRFWSELVLQKIQSTFPLFIQSMHMGIELYIWLIRTISYPGDVHFRSNSMFTYAVSTLMAQTWDNKALQNPGFQWILN